MCYILFSVDEFNILCDRTKIVVPFKTHCHSHNYTLTQFKESRPTALIANLLEHVMVDFC